MMDASEKLDFERAKEYRDLIQHIHNLTKTKIMSSDNTIRDVFGYNVSKGWMCIQVFFIRQGNLIQRDATMIPLQQQSEEEEFYTFIGQFYSLNQHILPKEVHVPKNLDKDMIQSVVDTKIVQPARGAKRNGNLANHNAEVALENKFELIARDESRTIKAIEELGERMGIQTPIRIEAFDNSNIQGVDPVSAMVTFVDGKADKKDIENIKLKQLT